MGSEMCIRDRAYGDSLAPLRVPREAIDARLRTEDGLVRFLKPGCCLLYTSDAADERSSVDLGGRRIIKK